MLPIMRSFQLDVGQAGAQRVMYARQGDSRSYGLRVTLVEHSEPVSIDDGSAVYLRGKKPDGTNVQYKALAEDGRIRAYFGSQAFTADGIMTCELMITDENGATLYAPRFDVVIEPEAADGESAESSSEFTALQEALTQLQERLQTLSEAMERSEIFHIRGQYGTLEALKAAVLQPVPGSAYNVGATSPFDIYVYTGDADQGDEGWLPVDPVHGTDGYSPTATVSKTGATATISITDKTGSTNAQVTDGTNGLSAYEVAVAEGYGGTQAQWLETLKGADGHGVPTGGAANQALRKLSATDFDTGWADDFTVLWTNASPGSSFAAQTIALSLSAYRFIVIDYAGYQSANKNVGVGARIAVGESANLLVCSSYNRSRLVSSSTSGLVFEDCNQITTYGSAGTTVNNSGCVPMRILGYK